MSSVNLGQPKDEAMVRQDSEAVSTSKVGGI